MQILDIIKLEVGESLLRTLCAWICEFMYPLIAKAFQLFIDISQIMVLTEENYKAIYSRVTVFLTIIMVFYVTFEFIKYLVEPDTLTDKEKGAGNIGKKIVIVIVLIAFVPNIFEYAWKIQNYVIKSDFISKIILGRGFLTNSSSSDNATTIGNEFSAIMFHNFYGYDNKWSDEDGTNECEVGVSCKMIVESNLSSLSKNGELPNLKLGINAAMQDPRSGNGGNTIPLITFDGLFAVLVGGFILYVLVLYTVDIAKRVFQLTYLQIIAPIPIIGYLSPKKDNMFSKWVNQCIATYLDLFIRLAIIYFVLLISYIISNADNNGELITNVSKTSNGALIHIMLILGLLLFAQKAPKLIEDLLPSSIKSAASGNFGLKAGERVAPLAARGLGLAWGGTKALGTLARNAQRAHARNVANGRHSIFTREGRQERRQDAEHRRERRRAQRRYENLTEDKGAIDEYAEANKKWQEKTKDVRDRLKSGRITRDQAKAEMSKLQQSAEFRRMQEATKRMRDSATMVEAREDRRNAASRLKREEDMLSYAQRAHAAALRSGDRNRIDLTNRALNAAQRRVNAAKKNVTDVREASKQDMKNFLDTKNYGSNLEQLRQESVRANEQVLKDRNEHYQGALGVAASTLGGTAKIMMEGAKSTKLGDVTKNVKQGVKNNIADVKAVQKYYDEGGTGWVDRTVQQVEKNMGLATAYERTVMQSRTVEPKIKDLDARASLTQDVKSKVDAAESRLKDKADELKLTANVDMKIKTGIQIKDASGKLIDETVTIRSGETLGDINRRYKQAVTTAETEADYATRQLQEFEKANTTILNREPVLADYGTDFAAYTAAHAAYKEAVDKLATLKGTKEAKEQALSNARFAAEQVKKNVARAEFTEILKDFSSGLTIEQIRGKDIYDGPAIESVYDSLRILEVARTNPTIVADMKTALEPEHFEAFIDGKIDDFSILDKIKVAAINAGNAYTRESAALKEEKRRKETSNETAAQKAANDYTSSGGK